MTTIESKHLEEILTLFNARELGEGDAAAGANLLAAMCCTLAAAQNPGCAVISPSEERFPGAFESMFEIHTHFIASGGHSASLVQAKVIAPLGRAQNRIQEELVAMRREIEIEQAKPFMGNEIKQALESATQSDIIELMRNQGNDGLTGEGHNWSQVVSGERHRNIDWTLRCPTALISTTTSPSKFEAMLSRANEGRPVLHAALGRREDFSRFAHQCLAVMDGTSTIGNGPAFVMGTLMATDPLSLLAEVTGENDHSAAWTSRALWLVDGQAGPLPPELGKDLRNSSLDGIEWRFQRALKEAWNERLKVGKVKPRGMVYENASVNQNEWLEFLRKLEPDFPGISGAARNLYMTLYFGLHRILHAGIRTPDGFGWTNRHILALAKFLVRRMVNLRVASLDHGEAARQRRLAERVLAKLGDGPQSVRDLTRRFNRLGSDECYRVLELLQTGGVWVAV